MKVLIFMAHADDEIIFGWPIFQDPAFEKHVFICSSDLNNPDRKRYAGRKFALIDVCKEFDIPVTCLDHPSDFYRLPSRLESMRKFRRRQRRRRLLLQPSEERAPDPPLRMLQQELAHELRTREYDYVFTHNPVGEYGHMDHRFVFQTVLEFATKPVLFTDIVLETNWPGHAELPPRIRDLYYTNLFRADCKLDESVYAKCESIYREQRVWTWARDPVKTCNVWQL